MRRALGIGSGGHAAQQRPDQARRRHRFVENGEVPVTVLGNHGDGEIGASLRSRIDAAEAALAAERSARAAIERRLQEASTTIQSLQSKLAHAALAHAEALEQERGRRSQVELALGELRAAEQRRIEAGVRTTSVGEIANAVESTDVGESTDVVETAGKARRVGRPRKAVAPEREPQPVSWWLPSYRAKAKRR